MNSHAELLTRATVLREAMVALARDIGNHCHDVAFWKFMPRANGFATACAELCGDVVIHLQCQVDTDQKEAAATAADPRA